MTQTDGSTVTGKGHKHGLSATDAAISALTNRIDALERRVTELEKPDPAPAPPPPGVPAFLSRPAHAPYNIGGGAKDVLIENVSIRGGIGLAIYIQGVNGDIVIQDVDIADMVGHIFLQNCTGTLTIQRVRSRNAGDGSIGSGKSNHIQLNGCTFDGAIRDSMFLGGKTEDMLSVYQSGGYGPGRELVIEDNALQGLVTDTPTVKAWTSASGTGIIVGDGPGSAKNGYTIVRRNTLLTPGQVGIQHIDGPGIQTYDNVIFGERRRYNNNPITSWEGNPKGVIRDNRYWWTNEDGSHPGPWMHQNPSGMVLSGNVADSSIDPATLQVVL